MSFAAEALACIRGERRVFAGVDFRVEPGGALILRGPNGAGKSSLLRLAAALLRPAAGLLSWDDIDIQEDPEGHRRRLCFVGHQNAVKGALDAAENLRDWIAIQGGQADGVAAALEAFGLGGLSDTPVQHFSAG
ncbi:MAG TPA: ATP-binding cassette domain-containing protein, partial [Alphaproteobacteria bacterium]|nr:ATP-binding cassette domain-containing protein [Alphaproteobacteria bacterium]